MRSRATPDTRCLFSAAFFVFYSTSAATGVIASDLCNYDRFRLNLSAVGKIPDPTLLFELGILVMLTLQVFFAETGDEFNLSGSIVAPAI